MPALFIPPFEELVESSKSKSDMPPPEFEFERIESDENIGIHPYWLRDIQAGAIEELRKDLKKWSTRYKGYLVGFEAPVQLDFPGSNGKYPQPYIYYKFHVVRYIYKPTVGQQLKGLITLTSQDAASCTVFDKFTATVYPHDPSELEKWKIGDTIEFELESFDTLREGVILRGTSTG